MPTKKNKRLDIHNRLTIQLWLGIILAIVGIALIWTGVFIAPIGEIHPTVLTAIGESFTFSGALIGVDYSYRFKRYKIDRGEEEEDEVNA